MEHGNSSTHSVYWKEVDDVFNLGHGLKALLTFWC